MKRTFMTILTVSLIANFLLAWPMQARGAGFIGTDGDPAADILSQPDKIYSFDPPTITWKMTSQFLQKYSHPKQQEQVRLAIEEWEQASFSAIKRSAPTYGWTRWNGDRDFSDLRSVLTHEIGHAIGSQHPDAVWFNNNLQLNFVPDNGSYIAQAPIGGEIMNEGNTENFLPGQKPPKGLRGGEYWRTVSQDELAFMDHAYPSQIDFIEVGFNDSAELIIDLFNVGGAVGSTLGIGGPDSSELRSPGDVNDGRRILQASTKINDATSRPIGFQASPHNWEVTNTTGEPINALTIKTSGTNNPNPTSWSSQGANAFQFRGTLAPPPVPDPEAFDLEDVRHFYNTPLGGQIANGNTVEVGLRQDVWDCRSSPPRPGRLTTIW